MTKKTKQAKQITSLNASKGGGNSPKTAPFLGNRDTLAEGGPPFH